MGRLRFPMNSQRSRRYAAGLICQLGIYSLLRLPVANSEPLLPSARRLDSVFAMPLRLISFDWCGPSTGRLLVMLLLAWLSMPLAISLGKGTLTVEVFDESSGQPAVTRMELWRGSPGGRPMVIRKMVPAGVGVVLDRRVELSLPEATYAFRMARGPEYRVVTGTFSLERTSLDSHEVRLPRVIGMRERGWTSGDCFVPPSTHSLPLRMAAEDLHLATTSEQVAANPVAGRDPDDPLYHQPIWISENAVHHDGLLFYGPVESAVEAGADSAVESGTPQPLSVERLAAVDPETTAARIAIENPLAWQLPVWLASGRIDGVFVLGDWLRLDRPVLSAGEGSSAGEGRGPSGPEFDAKRALGFHAERIYWHLLDCGFRLPPLAGCGSEGVNTPVGYNRLYVAEPLQPYETGSAAEARPVQSAQAWWDAAWRGQSVATNGPLLRPKMAGKLPGHVFELAEGESADLSVELALTVRDPVDYLEVIHNHRVHYSARLDEFAKAGGKIPPIQVQESGWALVRVVTLYENHFRAAISAPWYFDVGGRRRVAADSVAFFRSWLSDYEQRLKQLPPDQLHRHVPYIRAARAFWAEKAAEATD